MKKTILLFGLFSLFLFSNIAFAQNFDDIGSLIFRDLLQMNDYPGAPFSGNIMQDLIMFLLVPSVFIILVIYTLTGRLVANAKLDLLLSVTIYLFIIASGFYRIFALLAGPYFIFLIFILGIVYFFAGHFGFRGGGGFAAGRGGGFAAGGGTAIEGDVGEAAALKLNEIKGAVAAAKTSLKGSKGSQFAGMGMVSANQELGKLMAEFNALKSQFRYNPGAQVSYNFKLHKLHLNEGNVLKAAEKYLGTGR